MSLLLQFPSMILVKVSKLHIAVRKTFWILQRVMALSWMLSFISITKSSTEEAWRSRIITAEPEGHTHSSVLNYVHLVPGWTSFCLQILPCQNGAGDLSFGKLATFYKTFGLSNFFLDIYSCATTSNIIWVSGSASGSLNVWSMGQPHLAELLVTRFASSFGLLVFRSPQSIAWEKFNAYTS